MTSTSPYGSLATMVRSSARPTYSPWPLPRSASRTSPGAAALAAPMATEPSKVLTVRRKASTRSGAVSASRDTRDGITLASVVIGVGKESSDRARRSAWLSTSPLSAATTYGPPVVRSSSLLTGWVLGSEMIPTLAHLV